ncbi:MAG: hypothetical protein PHR56_05925 [Dehalococcoidales bacterium]|nr:hypothetical protein [Dehalococcoidales bacterium]
MNALPSAEEKQLVEEFGAAFEQSRLPRMAGRVTGWLLISEPPYQSAEQLAAALQASRGSISTMTRLLIQIGLVEQFSLPGERPHYFRLHADFWQHITTHGMEEFRIFHRLAKNGLKLLGNRKPLARKWLEGMHNIYAFMEQEFPAMLERWEREHYIKS